MGLTPSRDLTAPFSKSASRRLEGLREPPKRLSRRGSRRTSVGLREWSGLGNEVGTRRCGPWGISEREREKTTVQRPGYSPRSARQSQDVSDTRVPDTFSLLDGRCAQSPPRGVFPIHILRIHRYVSCSKTCGGGTSRGTRQYSLAPSAAACSRKKERERE